MFGLFKSKRPQKIRLFIGLGLSRESEKQVLDLIKRLQKNWKGDFCSAEKLHLTLLFLGWIPVEKLEMAKELFQKTRSNFRSFELTTKILELCIRDEYHNHLWIRFHSGLDLKVLSAFQEDLALDFARARFKLEKRKFLPHLTVARRLKTRKKIKEELDLTLQFDHLILYQSILTPKGSRYQELGRINA
jgi:2'-5' RNA ligase